MWARTTVVHPPGITTTCRIPVRTCNYDPNHDRDHGRDHCAVTSTTRIACTTRYYDGGHNAPERAALLMHTHLIMRCA